ncbi:MAG: hypothetical protein EHM60_03665, partial [Lysobacterales bacterium]
MTTLAAEPTACFIAAPVRDRRAEPKVNSCHPLRAGEAWRRNVRMTQVQRPRSALVAASIALAQTCTPNVGNAHEGVAATTAGRVAPVQAVVYFGGDILTMAGPTPSHVEALVVRDGRIAYVGSRAEALAAAGAGATTVDLAGRTLVPGFIDAHGHFINTGKNLVDADLFNTRDIPDLLARMKAHVAHVPEGAWIVGFGYQARNLTERRAPTTDELDSISKDRPVLVVDSSGHLGAANSAAFRAAGITADTPNPAGGAFARKADGKSLAGPVEETALNLVREKRPAFTGALADAVVTGAQDLWASFGQTTAMECGLGLGNDDIAIVRNAIDKRLLALDLYVCAKDSATDETIAAANRVARDYAGARSDSLSERQGALV